MEEIQKQIEAIEKEIRETPYHKATEHHIGKLRARLSKLRDKMHETSTRKSGGGGGYAVKKQGDATVVLVGPPSAGKSTLINKLTNARSKVAPYAFTTVTVIPGMLWYKDAFIQILDVPGLLEGAKEGKGRGREVLSVVRGSDLICVITDIERPVWFKTIKNELEKAGIRINIDPPQVKIEKKLSGGLIVHSNFKQDLDKELVKEVAREFRVTNAEITIKEKLTLDRLIDSFSGNRVYIPAIFVVNKIDEVKNYLVKTTNYQQINISAEKEIGLNDLKKAIWEKLEFVRVYLVKLDEEPSYNNPVIMKKGESLKDVVGKIGTNFSENKKLAKIWGAGAKFPGQEVSLTIPVQEGMQVRFL